MYQDDMRELVRLRQRVRNRISSLQTIVKMLALYELVSDAPAVGTSNRIPGAVPYRPPSHVTVNVNAPVGTLNTGEVLSNISSHVAVVTGSPSADAFREAVNALAAAIVQDQDLSDVRRKEALESIDVMAEEAGREPGKRRRGVLRGMLLAIPAAIEVSSKALEAWDKYSGPIRAHLGI